MGSAQSARGTQPGGLRYGGSVSCGSSSRRPPPLSAPAPVGRIFSAVVRRDRLWVGLEGFGGEGGRWLRPLALQNSLAPTSPLPGAADAIPRFAFLLPPGRGTGPPRPRRDCQPGRTVLSASQPRLVVQGGDRSTYTRRKGSAAMSATHPTRLETRTKESNAHASQRVLRNPAAQ